MTRVGSELPLGFAPAVEFTAGARQVFAGCNQPTLGLVMSFLRPSIPADALLSPLFGLADGIAQSGQVARRFGVVEVVELGEQGCSRARQLALLGLDRGTLLSQGGQLRRQCGILSPALQDDLPGTFELAARRRTGGLGIALRLPSRIGRKRRRREVALRIEQPALRCCAFPLQLHQPGALLQARRRAAPGVRSAHEAVPAPQPAIRADQPLTLAQPVLQPVRLAGIDHAHLSEAAPQGRWRIDQVGKRPTARRQSIGLRSRRRSLAPVARRLRVQAAQQIVTESGGERMSRAVGNLDQVNQRSPVRIGSGELGERARLRLDPLQRTARALLGALRRSHGSLGGADAAARRLQNGFRLAERVFRGFEGGIPRPELGSASRPLVERVRELDQPRAQPDPALIDVVPACQETVELLRCLPLDALGRA